MILTIFRSEEKRNCEKIRKSRIICRFFSWSNTWLAFCYCPLKAVHLTYNFFGWCVVRIEVHTTFSHSAMFKLIKRYGYMCSCVPSSSIEKETCSTLSGRDQISNAAHLHSRISKTTANYYITAVKCAWQKTVHTHTN